MNPVSKLKLFFVPTLQNQLRPYSLRYATLVFVILLSVAIELALFLYVNIAFKTNPLLANVISSIQTQVVNILPQALIDDTNNYRQMNGAGTLQVNDLLSSAAKLKAEDMAQKGYFSHVGPDGTMAWDWMTNVKYPYEYAGENLAINFSDAADVTNAWVNSPTHRDNLLNRNFTEVGVGIARGYYQGNDTIFIVELFGSELPQTPPVRLTTVTETKTTTVSPVPTQSVVKKTAPLAVKAIVPLETKAPVLAASTSLSTSEQATTTLRSTTTSVLATSGPINRPLTGPSGRSQPGSDTSLSFLERMLVAPRHVVEDAMIVLMIYIILCLLLPMIVIYRNHQSSNLWLRIRELGILFKQPIISSAVTLAIMSAIILSNHLILQSGIGLPQGTIGHKLIRHL